MFGRTVRRLLPLRPDIDIIPLPRVDLLPQLSPDVPVIWIPLGYFDGLAQFLYISVHFLLCQSSGWSESIMVTLFLHSELFKIFSDFKYSFASPKKKVNIFLKWNNTNWSSWEDQYKDQFKMLTHCSSCSSSCSESFQNFSFSLETLVLSLDRFIVFTFIFLSGLFLFPGYIGVSGWLSMVVLHCSQLNVNSISLIH